MCNKTVKKYMYINKIYKHIKFLDSTSTTPRTQVRLDGSKLI